MKRATHAIPALLALAVCITLALSINGTRAQFYAVSDIEMHVSIASPTPTFTPTVTPTATLTPEPTATVEPELAPGEILAPDAEPTPVSSSSEESDAP